MSVLDAFYILFQSKGADQVKKDEDDLKKSGDDLSKSMQDSSSSADKMGNSFGSLGNQLFSTLTAAVSLGAVLHGIKDSVNYAAQLGFASQRLAVNTAELDAWGNAVKQVGGTADQFQQSLYNLSQQMGLSGEDTLKILPQLADTLQKMGRFAGVRFGQILHIDENTILLLQRGRREVEALVQKQKELGVVSKEDAEKAIAFSNAWDNATHSLRYAFMELALTAMPTMIGIVQVFGEAAQYMQKHSDLIAGALIAIGAAAIYMNLAFFKTASMITLLVSAFSLLYEDIKYFSEGYDSFIGRLLAKFPILQKELAAFIRLARDLKAASGWVNNTVDNAASSAYHSIFGGKKSEPQQSGSSFALSADEIARLQSTKLNHVKRVMDIANTSAVSYTKPADLSRYNIPPAHKSITVNAGPTTINTQATDGRSLAQGYSDHLTHQITQANNYFDDGVQI